MRPQVCALSLAFVLLAPPLAAQTDTTRFDRLWLGDYDGPRRIELGVSAGFALSTDWSDLVALHVFDDRGGVHRQVLLRNVAVAPGAGGAVNVTYWRGRHGFRVHGGYSQSCLTTGSRCSSNNQTPPSGDAAINVATVPMDVWRYGVEGIAGLRNWMDSQFWRPYLIVGIGGVAYDPDASALPVFPGTFQTLAPPPGAPPGSVHISNGTSSFLISTDELGLENVFGLTLGIGMDFRVAVGIGGVALRLEVADQITSSPFSVRVVRLDDGGRRSFDTGSEATFRTQAIHNLRVTAGVSVEFGLNGPTTEHDPWAARR